MTSPVELDQLLAVAQGFGTVPMLLSVDDSGRPRAAAVALTWTDAAEGAGEARVAVGHRTLANAAERPRVALLWPAPPGERFALLADAVVTATEPDDDQPAPGGPGHARHKPGGALVLSIEKAILHQVTR